MKKRRISKVLVTLLFAMFLMGNWQGTVFAQAVASPSIVTFYQLIGQTSAAKTISLKNYGNSELGVTVSISGPFVLSENRCENGVRPGTHCNVYITYTPTPESVRGDRGTLTFTDNATNSPQTVALTGTGVYSYPTSIKLKAHGDVLNAKITSLEGTIPDGEQLYFSCWGNDGETNIYYTAVTIVQESASIEADPSTGDQWSCLVDYFGDSEFSWSESNWVDIFGPRH